MWHLTVAKYNKKKNGVMERGVKKYETFEDAFQEFAEIPTGKPVYIWFEDTVSPDDPTMSFVESQAYKNELAKVVD